MFATDALIAFTSLIKLVLFMLVSLPVCMGLVHFALERSLAMVGVAAVAGECMLMIESYFVFGLKGAWTEVLHRVRRSPQPA